MIAAKTKYFKIKNPETGEFEDLISIKGEKGDIGSLSNITSDITGTSEDLAISQAAIHGMYSELQQTNKQVFSTEDGTLLYRVVDVETGLTQYFNILKSHDGLLENLEERVAAIENKQA